MHSAGEQKYFLFWFYTKEEIWVSWISFSTLIKSVSILVCTIYIRTLVLSPKKKKTQKVYISVSPLSLSLYAAVFYTSRLFLQSSSSEAAVRVAVGFRKLPTIWVFSTQKNHEKEIWYDGPLLLHYTFLPNYIH